MRNETGNVRPDVLELGSPIAVSDEEQRRRTPTESTPRLGNDGRAVPGPQTTAKHGERRLISARGHRGGEASRIGGVRHDFNASRPLCRGVCGQRTAYRKYHIRSGEHVGQHLAGVIRSVEAPIGRLLFEERRVEFDEVRH
jgi:hypothetical protein